MSGLIVGLVGPIGVGKTTISDYLTNKGFTRLRFSDVIGEEIEKRKLPRTRKVYQDIGDSLRQEFGADYLSRRLFSKIKENPEANYIVDGFRNPGEVEPFRALEKFVLLGLNADPKVRFERLQARGEAHDPKSWEEFEEQEARDQGIAEPSFGQQVLGSLELADFVIETNEVKSKVIDRIEKAIKEFTDDPTRTLTRRSQACDFC